jgi:hypothetical protein
MGDELEPYTRVFVMFTLNYNGQERIIRTQGIVTNCQLDIRSEKEQTYAAGIKLIDMMDEDKNYIRVSDEAVRLREPAVLKGF